MAKVVVMPKLGYTQDEGQIAEWHKKVGDTVTLGEPFFDVHTDKTVITVEANCSGTLLKIALEPGETVPVLTPVAVVGDPGEDAEAILAQHKTATAADAQAEADFGSDAAEEENQAALVKVPDQKLTPRARKYVAEHGIDPDSLAGIQGTGIQGGVTEWDIKASPLARKVAAAKGVKLDQVSGSGAQGKVMKDDILQAAAPSVPAGGGTQDKLVAGSSPYQGVRKIIGDRLSESKFTAPHLYFTDSVDTTQLTAFRRMLNEQGEAKYSVSDFLIMAASKALRKFPGVNSALLDNSIVTYASTNVGLAVAGDNGLVVPVVKNVQQKTLSDVAAETRDLVERAKAGRLKPEEYSGGTFSISNLGMFGIGNFTAIINPPESAILSVSSVRKTPVVVTDEEGNDTIAIRPMMNIQLSVDHRIIDGLLASQFLEYYKQLLEHPVSILL